MSAGTITLTNKSAVVSGNGTSFTTDLAAGDFIVATVGGIAYTLPVLSITSATSLTLVSNFTGPTQSGNAWNAVPRVALNMVTAALVTQSAEALRSLNYDKQNWESVFTGTGTITVTLPDGSTFSGPSWKYLSDNMATKSGGAVPITQGGTGSTTAAGARTNLGLGSSDTVIFRQVSVSTSGYATLTLSNTSRASTDLSARVLLEVSPTEGAKPYFTQRYNDGTNTNQILNNLPTSSGVLAVQGTSGLQYKRDIKDASLEEAVVRIAGLRMVNFIYRDDKQNRVRFGFIAEEAEKIAPQYIKHNSEPDPDVVYEKDDLDEEGRPIKPVMRDRPSIDTNPIVMDLLGVAQSHQRELEELRALIKLLGEK